MTGLWRRATQRLTVGTTYRSGGHRRSRPRALFYSHDASGLGHLRRTLAVAGALADRRPDATLLALVGSMSAGAFALPANLDVVKLPTIAKSDLYDPPEDVEDDGPVPDDIFTIREAIIGATVETFAPDLVVVDHQPAGLAGEFRPALARLDAARPRPKLVLGLRDVTFGPTDTREEWRSDGVYELLDRVYDQILVYGCPDVFDPIADYGLSEAAATKTAFVGYVRRSDTVRPAAAIRAALGVGDAALVVVTAGGGMFGAPLVKAYLAAVRDGALPGVVSYVVAGPELWDEEGQTLAGAAEGLEGVTLVPFCDDLVSHVAAADVAVTMGGYNSLAEAISVGKRPVVAPTGAGHKEQVIRARRFAELGLVTMIHPRELSPARLAAAVRAELRRNASPPAVLDFGGLPRAGAILAAALEA